MSTLASTYWSDISGHFITCPTICHYNPDLLTVHDIFSDNKVLSYLILSNDRIQARTEPVIPNYSSQRM